MNFWVYVAGTVIGLSPDLMMDVFLGSLFHDITKVSVNILQLRMNSS